jgi:hypothetical protein
MGNLYQSEVNAPDNLIAGFSDVIPIPITVVSGEGELSRGSVLGLITGTETYALINSAGTDDGRRVATYAVILAEDIDATDDDVVTVGYDTGEFNENAVVFGGTDVVATHKAVLQAKGIYLKPAVGVV